MELGFHSGDVSHRPSLKLAVDYNLKLPFLNACEKEHGLIVKHIFAKLLQVLKPGYISKLVWHFIFTHYLICQALNENQISHIRNFCSSLKCLFHRQVDWIGCAKVFLIVATL